MFRQLSIENIEKKFNFISEWSTDVTTPRLQKNRKQINKVIKQYNNLQINGFKSEELRITIGIIEHCRQTLGKKDPNYFEELTKMLEFLINIANNKKNFIL